LEGIDGFCLLSEEDYLLPAGVQKALFLPQVVQANLDQFIHMIIIQRVIEYLTIPAASDKG
jgi:hypothetical protein